MPFDPARDRNGPFIFQKNAEQRQPPDGYEAVVQPGFSRETLLADLERAFRNLHKCNNWHRCLHADLLDGKHAVDLQLTVEDSDPVDSPDLNGGTGIDISVSSSDITFALDFNELSAATPVGADEFAFGDVSDSNTVKKVTLTNLATAITSSIDHGGLTGLGDNDHTQYASTPASTGMAAITAGGQTLTGRTLAASEGVQVANGDGAAAAPAFKLDVSGLTTDSSPDALDTFPFHDASEGVHNKLTLASLATAVNTAGNVVTAASTFATDNSFLRSDGTSRGAQATGANATMDDSGNASFASVASTGLIKSSSATAGIGYATGAGGTVTQATSKSTGVTINKACGTITMHNAALAAGTSVTFAVSCSAFAPSNDVVIVNPGGDAGIAGSDYTVTASWSGVADATFYLTVTNITTGSLSEALPIQFVIVKGVVS